MQISLDYNTKYRAQIRQRVLLERQMDRELEKTIEEYHTRFRARRATGEPPIAIIAEGDSWFLYPLGRGVISQLEKRLNLNILNLAQPGDDARKMLTRKQKKRLASELRRGPNESQKYDFLLFSGGGNDLIGKDTFYMWLHPYENGMQSEDIINDQTLEKALGLLGVYYRQLIALRDELSAETHLLFHAYDFAFPTGKRACWLGPWLEPGLDYRNVPRNLRHDVVKLFLKRFHEFLSSLASNSKRIVVVPTHGTLKTEKEWANEIHPTNGGFGKIADLFKQTIEDVLLTRDDQLT